MYSMADIIASLPPEKIKENGIMDRLLFRPLSFPVAWLALRMGLTPSAVSYFSGIVCTIGGVLFAWPCFTFATIGAILFIFFSVLDCVDGNMARVQGKAGPWGSWADAVIGFIAYTAIFFATGMYMFWKSQWWPVLLITGLTSSANLLTRVAFQIYRNIEGEKARAAVSFEKMLAENVGITGFLTPLLLIFHLCNFMNGMWFIIWFNAAFYGGGCLLTIIKLARKAAKSAV